MASDTTTAGHQGPAPAGQQLAGHVQGGHGQQDQDQGRHHHQPLRDPLQGEERQVVEEEPVHLDPGDVGPRPVGEHDQGHGQDGVGQGGPPPHQHRQQAEAGQHQQRPADVDQPLALGAEALADQRPDRAGGVEHDLLPAPFSPATVPLNTAWKTPRT